MCCFPGVLLGPLVGESFDFLSVVKDTVQGVDFGVDFEGDYSFQVSWVDLM